MTEFEIPEPIRLAFAGRAFLNKGELAKVLNVNTKTISNHVDAGDLRYIEPGDGKIRPRRMFTLANVTEFLIKRQRTTCRNSEVSQPAGAIYPIGFEGLVFPVPVSA